MEEKCSFVCKTQATRGKSNLFEPDPGLPSSCPEWDQGPKRGSGVRRHGLRQFTRFLMISILLVQWAAASVTTGHSQHYNYKIGDVHSQLDLGKLPDGETADPKLISISIEPQSGSNFINLDSEQQIITWGTSSLSDVGIYDVKAIDKAGLEAFLFSLTVQEDEPPLEKARQLSTCLESDYSPKIVWNPIETQELFETTAFQQCSWTYNGPTEACSTLTKYTSLVDIGSGQISIDSFNALGKGTYTFTQGSFSLAYTSFSETSMEVYHAREYNNELELSCTMQIQFTDPCLTASLDTSTLTVNNFYVLQDYPIYTESMYLQDSVDAIYGDGDYTTSLCGTTTAAVYLNDRDDDTLLDYVTWQDDLGYFSLKILLTAADYTSERLPVVYRWSNPTYSNLFFEAWPTFFVSIVTPPSPVAQSYTLYDSALVYKFAQGSIDYHSRSYTKTVSSTFIGMDQVTGSSSSITAYFLEMTDMSLIGTVSVPFIIRFESKKGQVYEIAFSFDLTILSPCESTTFVDNISIDSNYYLLTESGKSITFSRVTDQFNTDHNSGLYPSICGSQTVDVTYLKGGAAYDWTSLTISSVDEVFTLDFGAGGAVNAQAININWRLVDYDVTLTKSTTLTFCEVVQPAITSDQSFSMAGFTHYFKIEKYSISPSTYQSQFTHDYSLTLADGSALPSGLSSMNVIYSATQIQVSVNYPDYSDHAVYSFKLTCLTYEVADPSNQVTHSDHIFQVTLVNICLTTQLVSSGSVTNPIVVLQGLTETETLQVPTDTINTSENAGASPSMCGAQTMTITPSLAAITQVSATELSFSSTDDALLTATTITIEWTLDDYPDVAPLQQQFELVFCEYIVSNEQFSDQTVEVGDSVSPSISKVTFYPDYSSSFRQQLGVSLQDGSAVPNFITVGDANSVVYITAAPTVIGDMGTYTIVPRWTITSNKAGSIQTFTETKASFDITVADPCPETVLSLNNGQSLTYSVVQIMLGVQWQEPLFIVPDSVNNAVNSALRPSICGTHDVAVTDDQGNVADVDFVTQTLSGEVVTLNFMTTDAQYVGSHLLNVKWELPSYPLSTSTSLPIEVRFCNYVPPAQIALTEYIVYSARFDWTIGLFDASPECNLNGYDITYSHSNNDELTYEWLNITETSRYFKLSIYKADGRYSFDTTFTIQADFTNNQQSMPVGSDYYEFEVSVIDPCNQTFFLFTQAPRETITTLVKSTVVEPLYFVNDDANFEYGPSQTESICGSQSLTITESGQPVNFITQAFNEELGIVELTIYTESFDVLGKHLIELTWSLDLYDTITGSQTFELQFAQMVLPEEVEEQRYTIWDKKYEFIVLRFDIGPSDYYDQFDLHYSIAQPNGTALPTFISFEVFPNQINFEMVSTTQSHAGNYIATITCRYLDLSDQIQNSQYNITIEIIDPCLTKDVTMPDSSLMISSFTYEIGTEMEPIEYVITREPPGPCSGTITATVNSDPKIGAYGLSVFEQISADGTTTVLYVTAMTEQQIYANEVFEIEISYGIKNIFMSKSLPEILATYTGEGISEPPYFEEGYVTGPQEIPCLTDGADWEFFFPSAYDPEGDDIEYTFSSQITSLQFDGSKHRLYLDVKGEQFKKGIYPAELQVRDPSGSANLYELVVTIVCEQNFEVDLDSAYTVTRSSDDDEEYVEPTQPVPTLRMSIEGVITVAWDQEMYINTGSARRLQAVEQGVIDMRYIQQSETDLIDPSRLKYSYNLFWEDQKTLSVALDFDTPEVVSVDEQKSDLIKVQFNDTLAFTSQRWPSMRVEGDISYIIEVPRQMPRGAINVNPEGIQSAMQTGLRMSFILQFVLKGVANQLLSIIENLTLITHMFILSLTYPVNLQEFFRGLFPLIVFDIIPTDELYEKIFAFEELGIESPAISQQFDHVGYESILSILNMGSIALISFIMLPSLAILALLAERCMKRHRCGCTRWIHTKLKGAKDRVFWNETIATIDSQSFVLTIISLIQMRELRLGPEFSRGERFCSIAGILLLTLEVLFPVVIGIIYCKKLKQAQPLPDLKDLMAIEEIEATYGTVDITHIQKNVYTEQRHKDFLDKYGVLVSNLKIDKLGKNLSIGIALLFIIRKLMLALGLMYLLELPSFTIFLFNFSSLYMAMLIIYFEPYKSPKLQKTRVMQEIVTLTINYTLFCFTKWFIDFEIQTIIGNLVIVIVALQSFFFAVSESIPSFVRLRLWCIRQQIRRRAAKLRKQKIKEEKKKKESGEVQETPKKKIQLVDPNQRPIVKLDTHGINYSDTKYQYGQQALEINSRSMVVDQVSNDLIVDHVMRSELELQSATAKSKFSEEVVGLPVLQQSSDRIIELKPQESPKFNGRHKKFENNNPNHTRRHDKSHSISGLLKNDVSFNGLEEISEVGSVREKDEESQRNQQLLLGSSWNVNGGIQN